MNFFENFTACFTIAEIGVNHNGDINLAKEMIHEAKEAGADAVKFQTFKAEMLVSQDTPKVKYQKITTSAGESYFEMIKKGIKLRNLLNKVCPKYIRANHPKT